MPDSVNPFGDNFRRDERMPQFLISPDLSPEQLEQLINDELLLLKSTGMFAPSKPGKPGVIETIRAVLEVHKNNPQKLIEIITPYINARIAYQKISAESN